VSQRIVGVDAGGTKLAAGLVDVASGRVLRKCIAPTAAARGGAAVLADCVELARKVTAADVDLLGIGVPELVSNDGRITSSASWDWRGRDLAAAFPAFGAVHVESDVRAAALAEARLGAGQGLSCFVYLTIGTGVSHTLVIGGSPWAGVRGNAIVVGAPLIEVAASGPALASRGGKAGAEEVLADGAAREVVEDVAATLALEVARLVNALDPDAVIVGGGLGLADTFRLRVAELARDHIYADATRGLPIIRAGLGSDSGIVGAALAAAAHAGELAASGSPASCRAMLVMARGGTTARTG
jgi:glucokinase